MTVGIWSPDNSRLLKVWDADFMAFGAGIIAGSWTTALAQAQADYLALSMTRSGHYVAGTAADFQTRRTANGAPAGKFLWYDNTGGVFTNLTGSLGSFSDSSLLPATFFSATPNKVPDDLLVYNQEAPAGAAYSASPSLAVVPKIWDVRWRMYLAAYYASVMPAWIDGITPDVMGRSFADLSTDGTLTAPWHPLNKAATAHGDATWATFWVDSMATVIAYLQASIGSLIALIPNTLKDGFQYFATDGGAGTKLISGCVGGFAEDWLRNAVATPTTWPVETHTTASNWQDGVDMLIDAGQKGKIILTCGKLWPSTGSAATTLQAMQWFRYLLGSFLIGTNGQHFFHFRVDDTVAGSIVLGASTIVTGTGTAFLSDLGTPPSGGESLIGKIGGLYPIASVDSDTQITLQGIPAAGDRGTQSSNWATSHPMHGRHLWAAAATFASIPNYGVGVSSGPNPDPVNWYSRILNLNGTLKLGTPTDNYLLPISAQRQTGGGSAYYFRRFTAGLVIVNPTAVDVVGLNATSAPISAAAGGTWNDIGGELNGNGRTSGSTLQTITSLFVPAHSALILVHT